ncbi:MAG: GNAT family N-acetyltransferase [Holophagales bacterium]|jgi:ribosomal-protein-alanine N-acetyltransferase|nr:GNAT family N-acetyltransferase [Holophagales bacterium]
MTGIKILGPGSLLPDWVEALESLEFGSSWGKLDEFEILYLIDKHAFARWRAIPKLGEAELLRVAVLQTNRRTGIASRLMSESLKRLAANGCSSFRLEVRTSNLPAQKLYESLGWRQMSVRKAYYSDGEDALVYLVN